MWPGIWNILDGWFFGKAAQGGRPTAVALRLGSYLYAVIRDLIRGEMSLRAMGLVYATLLSTIPLLAFVFSLLKDFRAHRNLKPIILDFFRPIGPSAQQVSDELLRFADSVSSRLVGTLGFALLLWTLLGTIRKVEDSFNYVWRVELSRSFPRRIAAYSSLLVIGPALLILFIGLTNAALDSSDVQYMVRLPLARRLYLLALELAPYFTVTLIFSVLSVIVPNTRVRWRPAIIGAVAAGIVWATLGAAFATLFVASARLMIVYAGFAIVVEALLWTYFGWLILLAGAQFSFYLQNPNYLRLGIEDLRLSSAEQERLTLAVMYLVGQSHATGARKWDSESLAESLDLPGVVVQRVVRTLQVTHLLVQATDATLLPGKDMGSISVREILEAARTVRSGHPRPPARELPPVDALFARLESCWRECCAGDTLRDLVEAGPSAQPGA